MKYIFVYSFFVFLLEVEGWPCASPIGKVYSQINTDAVLQFTADLTNLDSPRTFIVKFHDGTIQVVIRYNTDRSNVILDTRPGVTITGNSTGNVVVTLQDVVQSNAGTYTMDNAGFALRCNCLYILGTPTKPSIELNETPSEGESATLTCSSTSTTTPSNHSLSLTYKWRVGNVDNPRGSRYSYSANRNTLTLSNVVKDDANKIFTCTATEVGGDTSSRSDPFSVNVHYGPENVYFSPSNTNYERAENTDLNPVTCTASCNPPCSFTWTKIGQAGIITSTAVLSLGRLTSSEAGTYRCTARRSGSSRQTKDLTVNVIYGPRNMIFTPNHTSYRHDENFDLPHITCSADCWDCSYSWKGPNSYSSTGRNLDVGRLKRTMAGNYTCTAKNTKLTLQTQQSKDLQIEVRYGPESVLFTPGDLNYTVDEGFTLSNITCVADCFPACTYKWTKEGQTAVVSNTGTLPLGKMQKSYAGKYTCRATNGETASRWFDKQVSISVRYGPYQSSTNLSTSTQDYVLNEKTTLPAIICSADCYPDCTYTWTKTQHGKTTTVSSTGLLSLGTLYRDDAATYICTAENPGKSKSPKTTKQVTVKVRYGPNAANISVQSPYYLTEGDTNAHIECSADCYPSCSYAWKNLTSGSRISVSDTLSFGTVNRYMTGDYKCTSSNAAAEYTRSSEANITTVVKYAPDVRIRLSTHNITEDKILTLFCDGFGVPSTYTYSSLKQMWNNIEIPNSNTAVSGTQLYSSIHFSSLKLEDTGTYTCTLNNGVRNTYGDLNQVGSRSILVEVSPKVLAKELRFTGSTDETAHIQIPIYSYPELKTVTVTRYDGMIISSDQYNITDHEVTTSFYGKSVSLNGSIVNMLITDLKEENFGNYTFKLSNIHRTSYVDAFVIAEGPPLKPKVFQYLSDYSIPTFLWQQDFNGGLYQSFVIQTSVAGKELWTNHTNISERDNQYKINSSFYMANITGLQPGIYSARIFANNTEGESDTLYLEATFEVIRLTEGPTKSMPIAAIAGGCASAVVVIVVLVLVMLKRRARNKDGSQTKLDTRNCSEEDDDDEEGEVNTVNPMYISADEVQSVDNTYAQPMKKKNTSNVNNVYAVVDKKKGKEKMENKKRDKGTVDGDIYENAVDFPLKEKINMKKIKNGKGKPFDENPYENPQLDQPKQPKKIVNKDGLIYADLAFNDQPKGQKKLVIHGLDSMTEYAEVDFTKKADPLPDSDEEDNRTKT